MNEQIDEQQTNFSETEIQKEQEKPLDMRVLSKIIFIRKAAYEEISQTGESENFEDNINTFLSDSSPSSLAAALDLVLRYIKQKRPSDIKAENWSKIIVEKSFGCSHLRCQELSKEILCELLSMNYNSVISLIKSSLSSPAGKNTKKIMQYEIILQHLISEFGPNIHFEAIDTIIKGLNAASNPGIRNLAYKLIKDIYEWDKENLIANQVLKEKDKETIDLNRKQQTPNRLIKAIKKDLVETNSVQSKKSDLNVNRELSDNCIVIGLTKEYYFSSNFMDKLSARHQKVNEKKKLLEELTSFLNQSPQCIQDESLSNHFISLFEILKNMLNENNTNILTAVIGLLSHLCKHFDHNEKYTNFLLDILPKLLDKFNLSNQGINEEVQKLLNDLVQFNLSFNHFLVFLENISPDDNINYTINILTFVLNQIKMNENLNMKSFSSDIIDLLQRLSIDENEEISNLAFNSIEILNIRVDTDNLKKEEPKALELKQEEPIIENNQPKAKTFRTIKKKKEVNNQVQPNKNNSYREGSNNKINEKENMDKTLQNSIRLNKASSNAIDYVDIKGKIENETSIKEHFKSEDNKEEEETINSTFQRSQVKKSTSNNDECIVGGKSDFNQMFSEEIKQLNKETEKNETPLMTEKEEPITSNQKNPKKSLSLLTTEIASESQLPPNDTIISTPKDNQLIQENIPTQGNETKEQALLDFQKKIDLALQQEEEISSPRNEGNDHKDKKKSTQDESQFEDIKAILGEEITINLDGSKWETKKQALEDISTFIQSNQLPSGKEEELFTYLKYKLKEFKETNFNINREAITLFINLFSTKSLTFNSRHHLTILQAYYDKLCDSKLKDQTNQLITVLLDIAGVNMIITNLLSKLQKKPNVNLLKEYAGFFSKCVEDYEINQLPIKEMVDLCKKMASNVNPQVRTASISLLCVLYKYLGRDIKILIKDIKESTLKIIEAEFEKVTVLPSDTPRMLKGKNNKIDYDEGKELITNKSGDLVARKDISKRITPKMIKDIRDGKWPEKKEACETIEKIIIESNMKILPDGLGELFNLIKTKLSDGNKNIVRMIISLLSKLIEATGLGFKPFTKQIALALLPNFSDKMQIMRDECHACLEKWVTNTGFDTFINYIPQFVKTENVELRIELLKVIMKNKELISKQIGEPIFREMASPLLLCLQDKSLPVRNAAEEAIVLSFHFISLNNYFSGLKNFKPAIEKDLRLILTRLKDGEAVYTMVNQDSTSTLVSSTINTTMRTQAPTTNHASTPSYSTIGNETKKDNAGKRLKSPTSEQKTVQSIKVYKKPKHQMSNDNIKSSIKKTLNTTPTHSNKESLTSLPTNTSLIKSPTNSKISTIFHSKKASMVKYPVFNSNVNIKPNKEKRYEFDRKYKFSLETLKSDSENKLRDQVRGLFTEDFSKKLFNEDFKQVVESIYSLSIAIQSDENWSYLIDNLDLILKIIGLKFNTNQNPLMVKALLEFFDVLYVKIPNVQLSETEVNIIVCLLVDKLGVSNNALKEHLQTLIDNFFLLITPSKAMIIALNCALGKNIKVKAEILEVLTMMYINQSVDIVNRQYARILCRFLSVNDNNVKGKTIALFKEIYSKINDELWSLIDINGKERECLEANLYELKRGEEDDYALSDDEENEFKSSENNNSSECSVENNMEQPETIVLNNTTINPNQPLTTYSSNYITNNNNDSQTKSNSNGGNGGVAGGSNNLLGNNNIISGQSELLDILKNLTANDLQERVNTIIIIHEFICAKYEDNKEILIQNIDNIVNSFIEAMNILFLNKKVEEIPIKFTKYLATVLCKIATNKELISNISYAVLIKLSEEILTNYLIENLDKIGDNQEGSIIFKSLNSTMLRLLENCNSSHMIICLLELIRTYRVNTTQNKLAGLAIQCLLKMNESIQKIIASIEIDKVLLHFHLILCDMDKGKTDLQSKSQTDQMIVRYIKNLINDIVKSKKEEIINDYVKGVKSHHIPDRHILKWIKNVLSSLNIHPHYPPNLETIQVNSSISKSITTLPPQSINVNNNHSSSSINLYLKSNTPTQGLNNSSKEIQLEHKGSFKRGESIIEDLKTRMLKQKNLARSNRNFNYSNLNTHDINNTITELKKKWNDVNKKSKGKNK